MSDPFRYFNSSPEVIRLVVMMYVKYPLSLFHAESQTARTFGRLCAVRAKNDAFDARLAIAALNSAIERRSPPPGFAIC
jgi:hypothetical protein